MRTAALSPSVLLARLGAVPLVFSAVLLGCPAEEAPKPKAPTKVEKKAPPKPEAPKIAQDRFPKDLPLDMIALAKVRAVQVTPPNGDAGGYRLKMQVARTSVQGAADFYEASLKAKGYGVQRVKQPGNVERVTIGFKKGHFNSGFVAISKAPAPNPKIKNQVDIDLTWRRPPAEKK